MSAREGWLAQAARVCAGSAAAYEAALLFAADAAHERVLIERCRSRYALLDHLLMALGSGGADARTLRAALPKSPPAPLYGCLGEALVTASRLDARLGALARRAGSLLYPAAAVAGDRAGAP
jgi:hypothetical protein